MDQKNRYALTLGKIWKRFCIDDWEEHADRQIAIQGGIASIGEVQGEGGLQGAAGRYFWQHLWGYLKDRWLQALHLQMNMSIGGNMGFEKVASNVASADQTFMATSIGAYSSSVWNAEDGIYLSMTGP